MTGEIVDKDGAGVVVAHLMRLCLHACSKTLESDGGGLAQLGEGVGFGQRHMARRVLALCVGLLGDTTEEIRKMEVGKGQFKEGKAGMPLDAPRVWKAALEVMAAQPLLVVFADLTIQVVSILRLNRSLPHPKP